jgi:hypothetical protein
VQTMMATGSETGLYSWVGLGLSLNSLFRQQQNHTKSTFKLLDQTNPLPGFPAVPDHVPELCATRSRTRSSSALGAQLRTSFTTNPTTTTSNHDGTARSVRRARPRAALPHRTFVAPRPASQRANVPAGETQKIIQTLFELQVSVHGWGESNSNSEDVVAESMYAPPPPFFFPLRPRRLHPDSEDLVMQFQHISFTANTDTTLPREVIQYVEDARNPDIYTREFVELVAKSNQLMNGKRRAFRRFRDVLAEQIEAGFPELREAVSKVQENTGGKE